MKDIQLFPSSIAIRDLFSTFGNVLEVQVVDKSESTISALVRFEHASSATVLAESNGMPLGNSIIKVRILSDAVNTPRLAHQDRLLGYGRPSRSSPTVDSDAFAFSIDHIRPHQIPSSSALKPTVQPFIPNLNSGQAQAFNPFPHSANFSAPITKPVSIRRSSLDVSMPHLRESTSSNEDINLAETVEKLLIGDNSQGETSESDRSSRDKNDSSDDSHSRTPPSSPHVPEEEVECVEGSETGKRQGSSNGKSDTVVEDCAASLKGSAGERWSAGNPTAQWISSAWCEFTNCCLLSRTEADVKNPLLPFPIANTFPCSTPTTPIYSSSSMRIL